MSDETMEPFDIGCKEGEKQLAKNNQTGKVIVNPFQKRSEEYHGFEYAYWYWTSEES